MKQSTSKAPAKLVVLSCLIIIAATAVAPGQGYALELRDSGRLTLPHHAVMNTGSAATIEAWVLVADRPTHPFSAMWRYSGSAEHKDLSVWPDGSIAVLYAGSPWAPNHGVRAPAATFPFDGRWHHLAFVRRAEATYSVYLDGVSVLEGGPGPCWLHCGILNATTETNVGGSAGTTFLIDTLRVSSIDRYAGPFTPARRWIADAATALLLQFDEGQGTTVRDEGPAQQVGSITGEHRWIPVGALANFAAFGTGCPGTGGVPRLAAAPGSLPRLGTTFLVDISGLPNTTGIAAIELGISRTQYAGFALPVELSPWNMPGCFLHQSRDLTLGVLNTGGRASWSVPVPGDPSLAGGQLHLQAWAHDPPTNPLGVITSNGGTATLGF